MPTAGFDARNSATEPRAEALGDLLLGRVTDHHGRPGLGGSVTLPSLRLISKS
jgi:hypothetical protein